MKKLQTVGLTALLAVSTLATSHPGRTASDGCHYCRTNCDSWGVPHNSRHCHGGYLKPDSVLEEATTKKVSKIKEEPKLEQKKDSKNDKISRQEA